MRKSIKWLYKEEGIEIFSLEIHGLREKLTYENIRDTKGWPD